MSTLNPIAHAIQSNLRRFTQLLAWAWAMPLTAMGLPVWLSVRLFGRATQAQFKAGVLTAHCPFLARCLKRHPMGAMRAVAVGCCVFAVDELALQHCLPHEQVHVQQAKTWGLLLPLAYCASSVWQHLNGRCAYADNYFERQANQATCRSEISV